MLETPKAGETSQVTPSPDTTMDNQQVTIADKAYMAALIDGEGSIALHRKADNHYAPLIFVGNTNSKIAAWIHYFFKKYEISYYYTLDDRSKKGHLSMHRFELRKLKYCQRFLRLIFPYLQGKDTQAKLLLEFVDSRLDKDGVPFHHTRKTGNGFAYAPWVHDNFLKIAELNGSKKWKNWNLNDCTLSIPQENKDTVSPAIESCS